MAISKGTFVVRKDTAAHFNHPIYAPAAAKQPQRQITEDFKQLQVGRAWNHQAALRPPPHATKTLLFP